MLAFGDRERSGAKGVVFFCCSEEKNVFLCVFLLCFPEDKDTKSWDRLLSVGRFCRGKRLRTRDTGA